MTNCEQPGNPDTSAIREAVLSFDWQDYSLHDVEGCIEDGMYEWANDLAEHIAKKVGLRGN